MTYARHGELLDRATALCCEQLLDWREDMPEDADEQQPSGSTRLQQVDEAPDVARPENAQTSLTSQARRDRAQLLHLCGLLAMRNGRHEFGLACLQQALALAPGTSDYLFSLGEALARAGRYQEALDVFEQLRELQSGEVARGAAFGRTSRDGAVSESGEPVNLKGAVDALVEQKPSGNDNDNDSDNDSDNGDGDGGSGGEGGPIGEPHWSAVETASSDPRSSCISSQRSAPAETIGRWAETHRQMGLRLVRLGRQADAERICRVAVDQWPSIAEMHRGLGDVLLMSNRPDDALACYQRAIELEPESETSHARLGGAYRQLRQWAAAAAAFRRASALRPERVDLGTSLAEALIYQGAFAEAATVLRDVLSRAPNTLKACELFILALEMTGRRQELSGALLALGRACQLAGLLPEAIDALRKVLTFHPRSIRALRMLADVHARRNESPEAIACLERIVELSPTLAEAHVDLGQMLLSVGDYARGWQELAWRPYSKIETEIDHPLWNGETVEGRTILLTAELGLGETIQFLRYVRLVHARGAHVILACRPRLAALARLVQGVGRVVPLGRPLPAFDFFAPLIQLPRILGVPEPLPALPQADAGDFAYMAVDEHLTNEWRERLDHPSHAATAISQRAARVGLCWAGAADRPDAYARAIPLAAFAPLADSPGVEFISLQQGRHEIERIAPPPGLRLVAFKEEQRSLAATAALVANLDLVITADTMTSHLAGALGRPVWTLLPFAADWRWGVSGDRTPWYGSMRLFRQPRPGDWRAVLEQVRLSLSTFVPGDDAARQDPRCSTSSRSLHRTS